MIIKLNLDAIADPQVRELAERGHRFAVLREDAAARGFIDLAIVYGKTAARLFGQAIALREAKDGSSQR